MHLKKIEQKINSLNNLVLKVNNEKNIFLIQIMKLNQQLSFFTKNAILNKRIILSLQKQYNVKNDLLNERTIFNKLNFLTKRMNKNLWVYITEEQKYNTDSYSRYEKNIIQNNYKKRDDFIVIGNHAKEFCEKNQFNILKYFSNDNKYKFLSNELVTITKILFASGVYANVRFVINSNKNYDGFFTVLPINKFDIDKFVNANYEDLNSIMDISKYKIYPNINDFINTEINIFLENSINALICESSFYSSKNGLVTTNKIIKQVDDEKTKLHKQISRIKSEKQIEEITLLTRSKRDI
ncbi:MAG: MSC_0622 family F1-like ATPase gamma subunit [Metamycoplasmataceae bacterium]